MQFLDVGNDTARRLGYGIVENSKRGTSNFSACGCNVMYRGCRDSLTE